ncbi:P-loop containing nucleoside triphosphate hydrolase protein [Nadsonia fulvescens var. elongata DSM 6958]|uniref:Replication factor C subunit 2 n=1 Tax=Nadsonia fulvescens var. elongata DSM 6958 TaxID=857566 RepID=A0A1E3PFE3_9ASCO|nr:P-loop containing nucleoside triphosphate hydrolase protein [Nadsonia fulvescens var. elongata DSM 6958]
MNFFDIGARKAAVKAKASGARAGSSTASQADTKLVPWVEKYRPKNLDDVTAQDYAVTVLKRTLQSNNLPHMLFYGPPGTGKTSTVLALAKELYGPELFKSRVLELNASDERGISIVREKVKNFARTAVSAPSEHARKNYPCPPYKIIILDEADSMTSDAQSALRRTMETYSKITRFCMICNYVTRIIDPLASRCSKFRFKPLDQTNALARLQYIASNEGIKYQDQVLETLLVASAGDLRKAITYLQSAARLHNQIDGAATIHGDEITVRSIQEIAGTIPTDVIESLMSACKGSTLAVYDQDQVFSAVFNECQNLIMSGWSATQLIVQIHDCLISDDLINGNQKNKIAAIISLVDKRLADGADEHLEILDMMIKISQFLNE